MVSLRVLLIIVSFLYCFSVIIMLLYLPSINQHLSLLRMGQRPTSNKPFIHPHVLQFRAARARCANLSRVYNLSSHRVSYLAIPRSRAFILKAYHDKRLPDKPHIRLIVVIAMPSVPQLNLHCHVPISSVRMYTIPGIVYQFNENHGMPHGGFIVSCPLPPNLATSLPLCMVRVTNGPSAGFDDETVGVDVPFETVPHMPSNGPLRNISLCVPPLFGPLEPRQLIEFVEFRRILGIDHIYFYDVEQERDARLMKVLNHYIAKGLVTRQVWTLPVNHNLIWYRGQMLAIHHCLYANMGTSRYTAFHDLDEAFVPRKHPDLMSALRELDFKREHCGFRFFSAFFDANVDRKEFVALSSHRTTSVSRLRTKCIVRPELIFEMGIHHISKQNIEEKTPKNIPEDFILLHHFRSCDPGFGMDCALWHEDHTALQFAAQLKKAVEDIDAHLERT